MKLGNKTAQNVCVQNPIKASNKSSQTNHQLKEFSRTQ